MRKASSLAAVLVLAGCAQLPPTPQDVQAKRFETLPDKAVIYVVRAPLDSPEVDTIAFDDGQQITTQRGTYYRWEGPPGMRRIQGVGQSMASVTVNAAPGQIYFVQHTVIGDPHDGGVQVTALKQINERFGRDLVQGSQLVQ